VHQPTVTGVHCSKGDLVWRFSKFNDSKALKQAYMKDLVLLEIFKTDLDKNHSETI